ncbi:hemin ABC transporter ATP-binding protein [Endozoicomonas montiporae]|uniref:Hemin ABC transporter ATP-binding protein n=1 Tax=Endozoicomonas montiporae TaxID=1027273 RepID=A0A081NAG6_9GAMM|nr:hemin ABC transporter ATP-binding protein [Endozoicomonas montiporae]
MGDKTLLSDISLKVQPGQVITVLGPNGAGKSTLMKTVSGEMSLSSGTVLVNGRDDWPLQQKALMLGVLPQSSSLSFPFTVEEVVLLGRTPCSTDHQRNLETVEQALEKVDGLHLRYRHYTTLSGGERQRVHMARVLVQIWDKCSHGDRFLLLDEPTSALDPAHQQLTLKVARQQADDEGVGVLVILHDLNLAARYSDQLFILQQGEFVAQGEPHTVLKPDIIRSVFDIEVSVSRHPAHDCPLVITH